MKTFEATENEMSKIEEFLEKVDQLCFEYKIEIWGHITADDGAVLSIEDVVSNEKKIIYYIDGDGRGK